MKKQWAVILSLVASSAFAQTPDTTTRAPKTPAMEADVASIFQGMGLEQVDTRPSGTDKTKFFVLPDDALRLPKDVIIVVMQPTPEADTIPRAKGALLIPDELEMTDSTALVEKVIRGSCSAAFFKNDGTGKLSRENLLGYSIVDGNKFLVESRDPLTVTDRIVYMAQTGDKYRARFYTDGQDVEIDRVKALKPGDKSAIPRRRVDENKRPPTW